MTILPPLASSGGSHVTLILVDDKVLAAMLVGGLSKPENALTRVGELPARKHVTCESQSYVAT